MSTKKKGRPEHDWDSIRQEYISTNISIKDLAKKYKVRERTVAEYCSKEEWVAKRKKYKQDVSKKVTSKLATKTAAKKADEFAQILNLTSMAQKRIMEMMQRDNLKTSDIRNLVESLEIAERVTRNIVGTPTTMQAHRIKTETERLELDKKKASELDQTNEHHVYIAGWKEEWGK